MAPSAAETVASCLNAAVPVYSFQSQLAEAPFGKLPRVDSIPFVPDFFSEPRCDSPMPSLDALAPFGGCGGSPCTFNDLPLAIGAVTGVASVPPLLSPDDAAAFPLTAVTKPLPWDSPAHAKAMAPAIAGPAAAHTGGGGRHLPRRHASDVVRPGGGGRGSLDAGSSSPGVVSEGGLAEVPVRSLLASALMTMWEDRVDRDMFRYDVTQCPSRVLPGGLGFIAQLNEGRATKKRPTEFAADRVVQPFNPDKFNFLKAAMGEVLLAFQPSGASGSAGGAAAAQRLLAPAAPLGTAAGGGDAASPHLVLINVSPIDYGHVLLLPRVLDRLPQALDAGSVALALQFAREMGSPSFRVGYNSLGAFGTINHLHFHTYHLPLPLPIERAAAAEAGVLHKRRYDEFAGGAGTVRVSRLLGYPVHAFVVEPAAGGADGLAAVAAVVGVAAQRMQAANQPFNLLVSDAGRRVFVMPQCYAERQAAGVVPDELLDTGVNPASFEVAGHLVLKRREDYEVADEGWAARLLAAVSLDEARFMAVAEMCFGDAGSAVSAGAGGARC
ncbi:hypothetical protein GPECTOR_59g663 [Gonium pectorale]|uniref:GDP-D-glucose phosphorylase 1 n=1 Tax=Gonium pectorale TaxID=33097 RepID=A0A150G5F9_GONPE|nr:hypothetical protein GPECTOR_59g663 [Gonium pectorale]|eukprot:KXZ45054.1 hypothetical protein GPECTOR_59g663 [Gonium pectorale]